MPVNCARSAPSCSGETAAFDTADGWGVVMEGFLSAPAPCETSPRHPAGRPSAIFLNRFRPCPLAFIAMSAHPTRGMDLSAPSDFTSQEASLISTWGVSWSRRMLSGRRLQASDGRRPVSIKRGLEVSLGGLAEDQLVEREIRHSLAQTLGLKLKILHPPDMIRL